MDIFFPDGEKRKHRKRKEDKEEVERPHVRPEEPCFPCRIITLTTLGGIGVYNIWIGYQRRLPKLMAASAALACIGVYSAFRESTWESEIENIRVDI